jgi:hypothetical protein
MSIPATFQMIPPEIRGKEICKYIEPCEYHKLILNRTQLEEMIQVNGWHDPRSLKNRLIKNFNVGFKKAAEKISRDTKCETKVILVKSIYKYVVPLFGFSFVSAVLYRPLLEPLILATVVSHTGLKVLRYGIMTSDVVAASFSGTINAVEKESSLQWGLMKC